jgi:hypothetical protein
MVWFLFYQLNLTFFLQIHDPQNYFAIESACGNFQTFSKETEAAQIT